MKLIKYPVIGLFIVTVVLVAANSFAQKQTPLPWNAFTAGLGEDLLLFARKALYDRGPGAPIEGYSDSSPYNFDVVPASTMISSQLRTTKGDYLAEINHLVIDPSNGRISNVALDRVRMMGETSLWASTLCGLRLCGHTTLSRTLNKRAGQLACPFLSCVREKLA